MAHPNEILVREFFGAFSRGDFAEAASRFADDVVLHVPGKNPFSGVIRGREEWLTSLRKYAEAQTAGIVLTFDVHDVVAGLDHAVALLTVSAAHEHDIIDWRRVAVYHVVDGRIQQVWIHDVDQYAVDDFFSRVFPG